MTRTEIFNEIQTLSFDDQKGLRSDLISYLKDKRAEIKESAKAEKEAALDVLSAKGKALVPAGSEGSDIKVIYGNDKKVYDGTITKIGEKTFTVEIVHEGATKKVWRYYHQIAFDAIESENADSSEE